MFITSCSETKVDGPFANWEARNLHFTDSIERVYAEQQIPELEEGDIVTGNQIGRFNVEAVSTYYEPVYVYYKVIDRAKENLECPYSNDTVKVHYRGMLMDEAVIGALKEPRYITKAYADLSIFDKSFSNDDPDFKVDNPSKFAVNALVPGFTQILQYMSPGDRWEVYIPAKAGYGEDNRGDLPGHSVLIFDLTLSEIIRL